MIFRSRWPGELSRARSHPLLEEQGGWSLLTQPRGLGSGGRCPTGVGNPSSKLKQPGETEPLSEVLPAEQ